MTKMQSINEKIMLSSNEKTYLINEIFYTLQGEGYHTGRPAAFVRFSGCNLKCPFCDTKFDTYTPMTTEEIISKIQSLTSNCESTLKSDSESTLKSDSESTLKSDNESGLLVVLTGGEPTLQVDSLLIDALHREHFFVAIETNGTQPIAEGIDWVTCSPKEQTATAVPSSPYMASVKKAHINELKIVYLGQDVEKYYNSIKAEHYYLQPCSNRNTKEVVEYILQHPHWHLSLQTHKVIGIK